MTMLQNLVRGLRTAHEWAAPWAWPAARRLQPLVRAWAPRDHDALAQFYAGLGRATLRARFHCAWAGLSPERARQLSDQSLLDPRHTRVLVAVCGAPGREEIVAHAGWHQDGPERAEFALVVADGWQGRGLGTQLMKALIDSAAQRGLTWLHASVLADNQAMAGLLAHLGLAASPDRDDAALVRVEVCVPAWRICRCGAGRPTRPGRHAAGLQLARGLA